MPTSYQQRHLREAAILTRAVENVLRKLTRLLIGRISLTRLQELLRLVFVEEAEAFLKREKPGKNVPMTKLALLTGLDTRTLGRLKEEADRRKQSQKMDAFLREITPECSILDYWHVNAKYIDQETGKPLVLPIRGAAPSFESLVAETLTSRGITIKSLLERLSDSRSVCIDNENRTVMLLDQRFWPFEQEEDSVTLEIGLISVGSLIDTVAHNVECRSGEDDLFFQRSVWTHRLNVKDQKVFRSEVKDILKSSEETASEALARYEEREIGANQITAGVCLFYFEEIPRVS